MASNDIVECQLYKNEELQDFETSSPIENTSLYVRSQQQLQNFFDSPTSSTSDNVSSEIGNLTSDTSGSAANSVQNRNITYILPQAAQKWKFNFDLNAATSKVNLNLESAGNLGGGDAPIIMPKENQAKVALDEIMMRKIIVKPRTLLQRLRAGGSGQNGANLLYSRKIFVGGLPPDIDEQEIAATFRRFGTLTIDWPHKSESRSTYPPKGYIFLLFQNEQSVLELLAACIQDDNKLYMYVSSATIKQKLVQIRPWRLADADYVLDPNIWLDPRKTVFVGGVPRQLKAYELAVVMDRQFGGVCHASIDIDPDLKYPKGAARVCFLSQHSYIAAISARFVHLQYADIEKRVEVKPYVLDDQYCDECKGVRCGNNYAPYFCANVTCLKYYCEHCWLIVHIQPGREFHKPLNKDSNDRARFPTFYKS